MVKLKKNIDVIIMRLCFLISRKDQLFREIRENETKK